MTLSVLLPLIFIPNIQSEASQTYEVGTSFSSNGFTFNYIEDFDSQPVPANFYFDDSVPSYVFDSFTNSFKMLFAGNYGALDTIGMFVDFTFYEYFTFFVNTAYSNGVIDVLSGLWNQGTNINYTLKEVDGTDSRFEFYVLGTTLSLWIDYNGNVITNSKGQPRGSVKHNQDMFNIVADGKRNQIIGDKVINPAYAVTPFGDLKPPYFEGRSLHFFFYRDGVEHEILVEDFNHAIVAFQSNNANPTYIFVKWLDGNHTTTNVYVDSVLTSSSNAWLNQYNGPHSNVSDPYNSASWSYYLPTNPYVSGICFPTVYNLSQYYQQFNYTDNSVVYAGVLNGSYVNGTGDVWLDSFSFRTVTDPSVIEIEPDVPADIPDIGDWIDDNEPDPEDPSDDPVIVDPFVPTPDPGPDPSPDVPSIPPIVSGNDDIWPDLNVMFDFELDLDGFLGPLLNFDFPDFNTVIDSVLGPLTWISGIMSLLYEGSDFGILFTILAVFFIASAILGIYKWWNN